MTANYKIPVWICLLFVSASACRRNGELSDTLAWMDNTYNPHADLGAGHGRTGWYAPRKTPNGQDEEELVFGSTETFIGDGCRMTLHIQYNPDALTSREIYSTRVAVFSLRDVNPQSVTISTISHLGGFPCEDYDVELRQQMNCNQAEIKFATHSEAPLIDQEFQQVYTKLQGRDHEHKSKSKVAREYFAVDDVAYADRFAKAFRHAVELCGGKTEPF